MQCGDGGHNRGVAESQVHAYAPVQIVTLLRSLWRASHFAPGATKDKTDGPARPIVRIERVGRRPPSTFAEATVDRSAVKEKDKGSGRSKAKG
jgi:hypothetical protein